MKKLLCVFATLGCLAGAEGARGYRVAAEFSGEELGSARPMVVTRSGQAAEIQIGKADQPGWTLTVTPTAGADAQSVKLDCAMQMRTSAGPERFQFQSHTRLGEPILIGVGERWSTRLTVELAE